MIYIAAFHLKIQPHLSIKTTSWKTLSYCYREGAFIGKKPIGSGCQHDGFYSISLQEKYTRVMRDKAELTDKAEELEHTVLQLQGETETIGILYTAWNSPSHIFALWRPETDSPSLEIAHSPIFLNILYK